RRSGTPARRRYLYQLASQSTGSRIRHMPLPRFERFVRPLLEASGQDGIETMCLIREPVDWLASWYRYRRRAGVPDRRKSTAGIRFEAFVEAYLSEDPPPFARVGRPARFMQDRDGRMGVDHLFRYEDFGRVTAFLSERFGTKLSIPHVNASPAEPVHISDLLRARIEAGMAEDMELWERAAS
ncbi:MAG: hypothetical protein AAFR46_19935, partial [Pseudomonadota bacterium]